MPSLHMPLRAGIGFGASGTAGVSTASGWASSRSRPALGADSASVTGSLTVFSSPGSFSWLIA